MEDISLADIRAATHENNDGFLGGGSGTLIILFLLILMMGGCSMFGQRTGELNQFATAASQNEILLGQKFDALGQKVNQIGDGICSSTYALNNSIINEGRTLGAAVSNGFADLQKCCCETQRAIDGINYNGAINTAAINANTTAQTQKILDAISANKINEMQNQINQLQLQNAVAGMVRYPSASTYYAGANPFCANTCNCNS